jgi:hypothetical protein
MAPFLNVRCAAGGYRLEADMGDFKALVGRLKPAIWRIRDPRRRFGADTESAAVGPLALKAWVSQLPSGEEMFGLRPRAGGCAAFRVEVQDGASASRGRGWRPA